MSDRPSRVLCIWPGLAGIWLHGQWTSLLIAFGFALLLNLALVATFVWPGLIDSRLKPLVWSAVGSMWLVYGLLGWRMTRLRPDATEKMDKADDTLFIQAQNEYLKGDFGRAETILAQRIQDDFRDVEARLLLVSLYRRTRRLDKAFRQLDNLNRLDQSVPWKFELERERHLLEMLVAERAETPKENEEPEHTDAEHSPSCGPDAPETANPECVVRTGEQTGQLNKPETLQSQPSTRAA